MEENQNVNADKIFKIIDETLMKMRIVSLNTLVLAAHISNITTKEEAVQESNAIIQIARENERICDFLKQEYDEIKKQEGENKI